MFSGMLPLFFEQDSNTVLTKDSLARVRLAFSANLFAFSLTRIDQQSRESGREVAAGSPISRLQNRGKAYGFWHA
jgi:hypothetical protein